MSDREWIVYYRENGMITFDRTIGLPYELHAPPWYAVTVAEPLEYRIPRDGRWVMATAEEIQRD